MKRRSFLQMLGLGGAAAAGIAAGAVDFDPERLLWVPGAKTWFLPSEHVLVPDADLTAHVLRAHGGPDYARYVLTVSERGHQQVIAFDSAWRPLTVEDVTTGKRQRITSAEDIDRLQRQVWGESAPKTRTVAVVGTPAANVGRLPAGYQGPRIAPRTSDGIVLTDKE